jgi:anti-sigma regulatory factor (Ser/Thr protein kinase)
MILRLTLDLPEERAYIKIIRLLGRTLLEHLNVVEQDVDEIEVVAGELCANVIRHAHSVEGRFRVTLEYHADRVVTLVEDRGPGFAPDAVAPVGAERPDFDGAASRVGGYGLRLVELLSDRVEFGPASPRGTTARAERRLRFKTPADALHAAHLAGAGGGFATAALGPITAAATASAASPGL